MERGVQGYSLKHTSGIRFVQTSDSLADTKSAPCQLYAKMPTLHILPLLSKFGRYSWILRCPMLPNYLYCRVCWQAGVAPWSDGRERSCSMLLLFSPSWLAFWAREHSRKGCLPPGHDLQMVWSRYEGLGKISWQRLFILNLSSNSILHEVCTWPQWTTHCDAQDLMDLTAFGEGELKEAGAQGEGLPFQCYCLLGLKYAQMPFCCLIAMLNTLCK